MSEENHDTSEPTAESEKKPSWFRAPNRIFDRGTPSGEKIHTAFTHILVTLIAFAIGMVVMYFWQYEPLAEQLQMARDETAAVTAELEQSRAEHEQTRVELQAAESEVLNLQDTVTAQEKKLERSETRIQLLRVMYYSRVAQSALQNRESAAARRALQEARKELDAALPAIEAESEEVAQSLTLRLDLAINSQTSDPDTAQADLEILINNIILLERLLAQQ